MDLTYNKHLNIFYPQTIDSSVESIVYIDLKTQTKIDGSGPFTFQMDALPHFADVKNALLVVSAKITNADDTALAAAATVAPANNLLHTLFSKVNVTLGTAEVEYPHSLYAYRAYMENLLFTSNDVTDNRLEMEAFIMDEAGKMAIVDPTAGATNSALAKRRDLFSAGSINTMIGKLHCDLFRQDKYLLSGVPMRVTLHRNPDGFCLMKSAGDYKLTITDMTLKIPLVKLSEAMRQSLETVLVKSPAIYPITRTIMQTHMIPTGTTSFNIPGLFRGNLPHTIILGMVPNANRRDDLGKNPFDFADNQLTKLVCYKNSEPVGYNNGLQMDFEVGHRKFTEGYFNLINGLGKYNSGLRVTPYGFRAGYAFFPFKIAVPVTADGQESDVNTSILNQGVLDVHMTFGVQTAANIDVIVYAQYNSQITIDNAREVRVVEM